MPELYNLSERGGYILECVTDLRDNAKHNNREMFRRIMQRVGFLVANELSKTFVYQPVDVETPLAVAKGHRLKQQPVVATILRAGLPLYNGVLEVFPEADNAFLAAYRKHDATGGFSIATNYCTCPDLTDRVLVVADPMLATGSSLLESIDTLVREGGKPAEVHVVCALAAAEGVESVRAGLAERGFKKASVWCAALDPELNEQKYIVPGLGDAGDLAFGEKKQA